MHEKYEKPGNVRPPDEAEPAGGHEDPVTLAAELLVRTGPPDAGTTLVREHVPDRSGRCRGCPHASAPAPIHPCRLRSIGDKVAEMRTGDIEESN